MCNPWNTCIFSNKNKGRKKLMVNSKKIKGRGQKITKTFYTQIEKNKKSSEGVVFSAL